MGRLALLLLVLGATSVTAGPPSGFAVTTIAGGFNTPTAFAYASDGRVFVTEKAGLVRVVAGGVTHDFLDLRAQVNEYGDRGLLGLALDPAFASTGWVYLFYIEELSPGIPDDATYAEGRVIRVRLSAIDPNVADPATITTLLSGFDNHHYSHSGGCLRFDPAGHLVVSFGDGSSYNEVDPLALFTYDLDALVGKLVRIDAATGDGVPGNPYYDALAPSAVRSKVIARGFRNPFRFGIDPVTGDVWVGDVGWNEWEEVNRVPAVWTSADRDLNFGWPCYEGGNGVLLHQSGYQFDGRTMAGCEAMYPPDEGGAGLGASAALYAYSHGDPGGENGSSVTGGAFYTGGAYPASYAGTYFFGDYARDRLQTLTPAGEATDFGTPGDWGNPVDIQRAPNGNIAYLGIGDGVLHELVFSGGNWPPVAIVTGAPLAGATPLRVKLSGEASSDPDGDRLRFLWDFGDGSRPRKRRKANHIYAVPGTYQVRLTVTDRRTGGLSDTATLEVHAGNTPPTVAIVSPTTSPYDVGATLSIQLNAQDAEDGPLGGTSVTWRMLLHHLGHLHYLPLNTGTSGTFVVPDHGDDSFLSLEATATDSGGARTTTALTLVPQTVAVTVDANVPGLLLLVDGQARTAPYAWTSIVGGLHSVTAPSPQSLGATTWTFSAWSDALPASHAFTTPAVPLTLTATYTSN